MKPCDFSKLLPGFSPLAGVKFFQMRELRVMFLSWAQL